MTETQSHSTQVSRRDSTPLPSGKTSRKCDPRPHPQLSEGDTRCVHGTVGSKPPSDLTAALCPPRGFCKGVQAAAEQHPDQRHHCGRHPGWAGARPWWEAGLLHQPLT